jgi:hypothetical protein
MTTGTVDRRRVSASGMAAVLALAATIGAPLNTAANPADVALLATLELRDGDIEYELELDTLHFFDEEGAPFGLQVIDGCALNDHFWIFGAGLSGVIAPIEVVDLNTGKNHSVVLPPFEPGKPVGTVLEPEALRLCGDAPVGGLPVLDGTAIFTSADARGQDATDAITLLSDGRDDTYRRIARGGSSYPIITKGSPIAAVDDSAATDQLYLLTEGRTPRHVEGIVFSGREGMVPARVKLDQALKRITNGRVRRAFETAKGGRVPQGLVEDLGLKRVDRVHHVSLDFETFGADSYLAEAGWIKEGGAPIEPPKLVEERFTVELMRAGGASTPVPLAGPFVGTDDEGQRWEYASDDALVEIIDACGLSGSFWTVAGVATDEPVELIVTDTRSGTSASHLVWTDRRDVSRLADTSSLPVCP